MKKEISNFLDLIFSFKILFSKILPYSFSSLHSRQPHVVQDMSKVDHYVMPDQKKGETSSYVEVDEREKAPNAEQKKWEEEHLALGE